MSDFTYSIDIHAPKEIVFDCINDNEKQKIWMEGLQETYYAGLYDPENPVGTKFKQKIKEGGRVVEYDGEVIAYDRPDLIAVKIGNQSFAVNANYELNETLQGTRLDYRAEMGTANTFTKIMGFMFGWLTKRILHKQMTSLKKLAESEAKVTV
ncbi:SRPBCC family protein [Alkalihalobacillus sp. TS-13]|uniref:SRPBCC family protein n=1 Tax=Alkalihalobacillus sp. TS-13 TaxID=2842455 RepID=UPI001C87E89B|nr:SRPBCC family protein [Alkalihalobacillus sp. TS-13]